MNHKIALILVRVRQVPVRVKLNLAKSLLENDSLLNTCNEFPCEHGCFWINRDRVDACSNEELCELRLD